MNEKKTKVYQRKFRIVCWLITLLIYSIFIYNVYSIFSISGNKTQQHPMYIFGVFLAYSSFPMIFWGIYLIVVYAQNKNIQNSNQMKLNKIITSEYGQEFTAKLNALNELLEFQSISIEEFDLKKKLLTRKTEKLVDYSNDLKSNLVQIQKLKKALELGVIKEEEYLSKVKKLNDVQLVIRQRVDDITKEDIR